MNFQETRRAFYLPEELVYLDGNSLGPLPLAALSKTADTLKEQWGEQLIRAWNQSDWVNLPNTTGNRIATLLGAPKDSIVLGDTLSIKVYQALAAAQQLNPKRRVILSDTGNFPTDLYMAQGLISMLNSQSNNEPFELRLVKPEEVADNINEDVSVLLLTQVDYRSGRMHNMQTLTEIAHQHGVITVWDLAHSAGAVPVDLTEAKADFAVGCTYKYLNGGPGAPAFIYVAPHLLNKTLPALPGWFSHASPFDFNLDYKPVDGISQMRIGTPPVVAFSALNASLDIWEQVDMQAVRHQSIALSERFIEHIERDCPELELASPRDAHLRGSQVSFKFEHGFAAMQALAANGVIGDFRAPNIMRFGITPLYINEQDIDNAAAKVHQVISQRLWDQPIHQHRGIVT